jgi:hypothetical protein
MRSRRDFVTLSAASVAAGFHLGSPTRQQTSMPTADTDALRSEFLLDLTLDTQPPNTIGSPGGDRVIVAVTGGSFQGPRLKGTVMAGGGDWIVQRPDGSRVLDVRILMTTDDGQKIYVSWVESRTPRTERSSRESCRCSRRVRTNMRGSTASCPSACIAPWGERSHFVSTESSRTHLALNGASSCRSFRRSQLVLFCPYPPANRPNQHQRRC